MSRRQANMYSNQSYQVPRTASSLRYRLLQQRSIRVRSWIRSPREQMTLSHRISFECCVRKASMLHVNYTGLPGKTGNCLLSSSSSVDHECQLLRTQPGGPTDPAALAISNHNICGSRKACHPVDNDKIRVDNAPPGNRLYLTRTNQQLYTMQWTLTIRFPRYGSDPRPCT